MTFLKMIKNLKPFLYAKFYFKLIKKCDKNLWRKPQNFPLYIAHVRITFLSFFKVFLTNLTIMVKKFVFTVKIISIMH